MSATGDQISCVASLGTEAKPCEPRQLVFGQLGGCNLTQIIRFVPGAQVGPHAVRASMASLVSLPLDRALYNVPACPLKTRFIEADFQKKALGCFLDEPWDVLLLDLLRDYFTGSVHVGSTYVTELSEWVHGEPLKLQDVFNAPYEVIDWRHPSFVHLWNASAVAFYEKLLKPRLDAGKHVVVAEIYPTSGAYKNNGEGFVATDNREMDDLAQVLKRMYEAFAALDPRIAMLRVERSFHIGAFDTENGPYEFHMVPDFHARAGELLSALLQISPDITAAHIAQKRLVHTRQAYENRLQSEDQLRADALLWHARTEDAERQAIESRESLEASSDLRAALGERVDAEALRTQDYRQQFQFRESALRQQLAERENDFRALAGERDELMTRFREHVGHYDALREELDRRVLDDDANYEAVLSLVAQLRGLAERHPAMADHASLQAEAGAAINTLSQRLSAAKHTLGHVEAIVTSLDDRARLAAIPVTQ